MATRDDRRETAKLYGGTHSDAFQPKKSWTNDTPTRIHIPTNSSRSLNPFASNRFKNDLHDGTSRAQAKRQSNPIRGRTIFQPVLLPSEPAAKRVKVDSSTDCASGSFQTNGDTVPRHTTTAKAAVIDLSLDDHEEDLGTPVHHPFSAPGSPDPLALIPGQPISGGPSYAIPSRTVHCSAPDGSFTKRLRKRRAENGHSDQLHSGSDSDQIESASEFDRPKKVVDKTASGFVKAEIAKLNANGITNVGSEGKTAPHLDLLNVQKKSRTMKPKDVKLRSTRTNDDVLTESTLRPPGPKSTRKYFHGKEPDDIPIAMWIQGTRFFDDGRYTLKFKSGFFERRVIVEKGKHLCFDVLAEKELKSVEVSMPANPDDVRILVLKTCNWSKERSKSRETEYFVPGTKEQGTIAFKFDTAGLNWNVISGRLVQYFKNVMKNNSDVASIDGSASRTEWALIANEANHAIVSTGPNSVVHTNLDDSPLTPETEFIKTQKPPPPVVPQTKAFCDQARPIASTSTVQPLRRSSRQSTAVPSISTRNSPLEDIDELILVYPPTGTGAVNITRGDINRLQPGQYLNDTLIEFGLKLWLNDLRQKNEELAEQIHVFSSFFYKKLNAKNKDEGYRSVCKWTQKFDIFKKKYIIVPINEHLHWYLAVIYHPGRILSPPPPPSPQTVQQKPVTRKRKRESDVSVIPSDFVADQSRTDDAPVTSRELSQEVIPDSCPPSPTQHTEVLKRDEDEKEVEEMVIGVARSCSISDNIGIERPISAGFEGRGKEKEQINLVQYSPPLSPMDVDQEAVPDAVESDATRPNDEIELGDENNPPSKSSAVAPSNFYTSSKNNKKREAEPDPLSAPIELDSEKKNDDNQRAWIFIFDSLGGRHPGAARALGGYLRYEAADKKSVTEITPPNVKNAQTPIQTNFCDCGVFLLHLAKTFMKDPEKAFTTVVTTTRNRTSQERAKDWDGDLVESYREDLIKCIYELQQEWKAEKEKTANKDPEAEKNQVVEVVEDTDDEIIIEEVFPPAPALATRGGRGGKSVGGSSRRGGGRTGGNSSSNNARTIKKPPFSSAALRLR